MEFPFGHGQHHRRDEKEEERRPYPPPEYHPPPPPPSIYGGGGEGFGRPSPYPPSFPPVQHVSHELGTGFGRHDYPPVYHVSHESGYGHTPPNHYPPTAPAGYGQEDYGVIGHQHHHYEPPPPLPTHHEVPHLPDPPPYSSGIHHVGHEKVDGPLAELARQPTVRIYCKAEPNYSLSIRDGNVILARNDPSDERQHWYKDMKYSTKVKDEEGFPAFSLVNKVTCEAIKHSIGKTYPVRLVPYKPDYLDESVLWAESKDVGDGFRCIRMVNNIRLNFDAFHGDKDHGGVKDGTTLVLWDWLKGDNQMWKIVPH